MLVGLCLFARHTNAAANAVIVGLLVTTLALWSMLTDEQFGWLHSRRVARSSLGARERIIDLAGAGWRTCSEKIMPRVQREPATASGTWFRYGHAFPNDEYAISGNY